MIKSHHSVSINHLGVSIGVEMTDEERILFCDLKAVSFSFYINKRWFLVWFFDIVDYIF